MCTCMCVIVLSPSGCTSPENSCVSERRAVSIIHCAGSKQRKSAPSRHAVGDATWRLNKLDGWDLELIKGITEMTDTH